MKVRIDPALLERESTWDALDEINTILHTGQHVWSVDDPAAIERSSWLSKEPPEGRAGRRIREILQKSVSRAFYSVEPINAHSQEVCIGEPMGRHLQTSQSSSCGSLPA
ncbi:MAG: hypothetical protein HC927_01360 [Deltaproteobacteria bacterium]|nr:hypothetical protein [Deltaproteobacteria bacterium]